MAQLIIIRCDDYTPAQVRSGLHLAFEALSVGQDFRAQEQILIKPNLLSAVAPDQAVTPHPEVFRALIQNLQPMNLRLSVGDSPAFDSTEKAMRLSGLADVATAMDVKLADFDNQVEIEFPQGRLLRRFPIAVGVASADGLISLCKLKTHALTGITGAIKNQFGVVPGQKKSHHHVQFPDLQAFGQMLVDINLYLQPRLYVMDAIVAMEGNGPRNGQPRHVGLILVSKDPVLLDAFGAFIIGINPQTNEMIQAGASSGLGSSDLKAAAAILYDLRSGQLASDRERRGKAADFAKELRIPDFVGGQSQRSLIGILSKYGAPIAKSLIMNRPTIRQDRCTRCGVCIRACPLDPPAVDRKKKDAFPSYQYKRCIRCYCCQEVCPAGAIDVRKTLLGRLLRF
jgi:uncharacterized protein (DUF362 family)/Pyruvate/2-oxoacid:ferredoxin oxidoreductase delta subunit